MLSRLELMAEKIAGLHSRLIPLVGPRGTTIQERKPSQRGFFRLKAVDEDLLVSSPFLSDLAVAR